MTGLWASSGPLAAAGRGLLGPAAQLYGAAVRLRTHAYATGWRRRHGLPLPAFGIGSLQVGGAGKTPVASWAAAWLAARGARPGILLRGYGGDEAPLHRAAVPTAVVVEDRDRLRGAAAARAAGAQVLVLDDNAQHLRVVPDRQLLLFAVEALAVTRRLLPAGPWRQPVGTGPADLVVLTRKIAPDDALAAARAELRLRYPSAGIAALRLEIAGWHELRGNRRFEAGDLRRRALFALSGIADSRPFLAHVQHAGELRAARSLRDHARYPPARVRRIARAAESARVDYVVTTAKDAVKLRSVWPTDAPPVLVAELAVAWDEGEELVTGALAECLPGVCARSRLDHAAAHTAAGTA